MSSRQHEALTHKIHLKQFTRGLLGTGALGIGQRLLQLLISILLARTLEVDGFGTYSYVVALVTLLAVIAQFGIPSLVLRDIAAYVSAGRWGLTKGLLLRASLFGIVFSLLVASGALVLLKILGSPPSFQWPTFLWGLLLLPVGALAAIWSSGVCGFGHIVKGQLPEQLIRPGLLTAGLVAMLLCDATLDATTAMILNVSAAAIAAALSGLILRSVACPRIGSTNHHFEADGWWKNIVPFGFIAVVQILNSQTDILLLGFFAKPTDVGIYRAASQGAALVAFSLVTVNTVIGPSIARFHSAGDRLALQNTITAGARVVLIGAVPIATSLLVFGPPLLEYAFGRPFRAGALALAVLSFGHLISACLGSVALILNMTGHERDSVRGLSIGAATNLLLNLILIPSWGANGAAFGTALSLIFVKALLARSVHKRTGLVTTAFKFSSDSRPRNT